MIVAGQLDIEITQGFPFDLTWDWTLDGQLAPLAGHTGYLWLKDADSPYTVVMPATVDNGKVTLTDPGNIAIHLSHVDTAALGLGMYEWKYVDVDLDLVPNPVLSGRCRVVA